MNKIELHTNPIAPSTYWPCLYYPFGMVMPGREYNGGEYKFGYNRVELETQLTEVYSFEYRTYSSRFGRFFSCDPLMDKFPWNSTYAFAENRVIDGRDLEGGEWSYASVTDEKGNIHITLTLQITVVDKSDRFKNRHQRKLDQAIQDQFKTMFNCASYMNEDGKFVTFSSVAIITHVKETPAGGFGFILKDDKRKYKKNERKVVGIESPSDNTQEGFGTIWVSSRTWHGQKLRSFASIANNGLHEVIHPGLKGGHPFEENNTYQDVAVIPSPDNPKVYKVGPKADFDLVVHNIMMYTFVNVEGKPIKNWVPNPAKRNQLSPDQTKDLIKKIDADVKAKVKSENKE